MVMQAFHLRTALRGWVGLAGLAPALLILAGGVLHSVFGYSALADAIAEPGETWVGNAFSILGRPAVVLTGMIGALVLNWTPAIQAMRDRETGTFRVQLCWQGAWINIAVALLSALVTAMILGYVAVENFAIVVR